MTAQLQADGNQMKASEVIDKIQELISQHGDLPLMFRGNMAERKFVAHWEAENVYPIEDICGGTVCICIGQHSHRAEAGRGA